MSGVRWTLIGLTLVGGAALLFGVRAYFNWIIRRAATKTSTTGRVDLPPWARPGDIVVVTMTQNATSPAVLGLRKIEPEPKEQQ